jgi:hypothetical protein
METTLPQNLIVGTPSPTEARAIAKEAYIYGFPMVDDYCSRERPARSGYQRPPYKRHSPSWLDCRLTVSYWLSTSPPGV